VTREMVAQIDARGFAIFLRSIVVTHSAEPVEVPDSNFTVAESVAQPEFMTIDAGQLARLSRV